MAVKRNAALVRHYACQLGVHVVERQVGKNTAYLFGQMDNDRHFTPFGASSVEYMIKGTQAALAWLSGYAAGQLGR